MTAPLGSPAWFVDMVEKSNGGPAMHIIDLTPNLAKFILDVNKDNRSVRNVKVAQYAADMAAGNWALNGEPIIISKDGNLNDGQHRCLAVLESNTSVPAILMFGVERETRLTLDQGAMRSASDILAMDSVPNAATAAAIARMAIAYDRNSGKGLTDSGKVTTAEVKARVQNDGAIALAATFAATNSHYSRAFAAGSVIGFTFYILSKIDRREAEWFLERVCRGDGLKIKDPAHTVREKLTGEGRVPRDRKINFIFKAWNFHRRGMKVARESLNSTLPFPALL